jgi:hypothetical protein
MRTQHKTNGLPLIRKSTAEAKRKGTDGDGEDTSLKAVVTVTGEDTLTWQALERTGGVAEGPSPVYTFKRAKRAKKAAK